MCLLKAERICKRYLKRDALREVSFTASPGEIIALLGRNGAGKSTLMNILTGYLAPTSGQVRICGHDMTEDSLKARACIGYLPEQPPLYPDMTVKEYLRFCADLKPIPESKKKSETERVIAAAGLGNWANRLSGSLSKGYRQRLGLAQALLGSPPLLILDEPGSGMDPLQMVQMRDVIRQAGETSTVLLSSHMLSEFTGICSRALVLEEGQAVYDGPLSALLRKKGELRVRYQGEDASMEAVSSLPGILSVSRQGDEIVIRYRPEADCGPAVYEAFKKMKGALAEMRDEKETLEDAFLRLTGKGAPEA